MSHFHPCRPAAFRRMRMLIIGCGDVGQRVAARLHPHIRIRALTSSPTKCAALRQLGITPLLGNLDDPATLGRLAGLASHVLHLAPPQTLGRRDQRTRALLGSLGRRTRPRAIVYGSTTGVYGDAQGLRFDETRPVAPANERAFRRVDAERRLRAFGHSLPRSGTRPGRHTRVSILRIPGIYAADRDGGPRDRLLRGSPVLRHEDDIYTNHIHADDLARACVLALFQGAPQRTVHACDNTDLRMGDYFDLAAVIYGLPRPPRVSRDEAAAQLSPMQMSFLSESRRLINLRLTSELGLRLLHPDVAGGLLSTSMPPGHPRDEPDQA